MKYALWALVVSGIWALSNADARGQAKSGDAAPEAAQARARLITLAYLEGQLVVVDGDEKRFSIVVTEKAQVINTKMQGALVTAQRNYSSAAGRRDGAGMSRYAKAITDAQAKLYDTKELTYDFDLKGSDKLAVRTITAPTKDDGSKLSSLELSKLRGSGNLPGYQAEVSELTKGQWVRAYLDRNKLAALRKDPDAALPLITLVLVPAKEQPAPPKK